MEWQEICRHSGIQAIQLGQRCLRPLHLRQRNRAVYADHRIVAEADQDVVSRKHGLPRRWICETRPAKPKRVDHHLHDARPRPRHTERSCTVSSCCRHHRLRPERRVLCGERDHRPSRVHAGRAARLGKAHDRGQRQNLDLVGQQTSFKVSAANHDIDTATRKNSTAVAEARGTVPKILLRRCECRRNPHIPLCRRIARCYMRCP